MLFLAPSEMLVVNSCYLIAKAYASYRTRSYAKRDSYNRLVTLSQNLLYILDVDTWENDYQKIIDKLFDLEHEYSSLNLNDYYSSDIVNSKLLQDTINHLGAHLYEALEGILNEI